MDFNNSKIKWLSLGLVIVCVLAGCKSEDIKVVTTFTFDAEPDPSCMLELFNVPADSFEAGKAIVEFKENVSKQEMDYFTEIFDFTIAADDPQRRTRILNVPKGQEKEWVCTFININVVQASDLAYLPIMEQ